MSPEQLKLAFALDLAQRIVDADDEVAYGEFSLWGQIFPRSLLRQLEFVDEEDRYTETFERARAEADRVLAESLPPDEKLDLLLVLHGTAVADGRFDAAEQAVLEEAAERLGVSRDTLAAAVRDREADLGS